MSYSQYFLHNIMDMGSTRDYIKDYKRDPYVDYQWLRNKTNIGSGSSAITRTWFLTFCTVWSINNKF